MSVRGPLLPSLLALVLGAGTAGLAACGDDGDRDGLLRPADAQRLLDELEAARDALAGGECTTAIRAANRASSLADDLPRAVDDRLKSRIRRGLDALEQEIGPDCEEQVQTETVPTTTTTVPETTPTETVPTQTETTPTEPETTPTEPVPPPTDPEVPTQPDGTGGVSPEEPQDGEFAP